MGSNTPTHLFVSLRCMRIDEDGSSLFAGGGIMAGSNLEVEWKETEDKMCTMKDIMHVKK